MDCSPMRRSRLPLLVAEPVLGVLACVWLPRLPGVEVAGCLSTEKLVSALSMSSPVGYPEASNLFALSTTRLCPLAVKALPHRRNNLSLSPLSLTRATSQTFKEASLTSETVPSRARTTECKPFLPMLPSPPVRTQSLQWTRARARAFWFLEWSRIETHRWPKDFVDWTFTVLERSEANLSTNLPLATADFSTTMGIKHLASTSMSS
mmetsp:Transcript_19843/g.39704  ORF Transcript_19843/g.39704 Transcript_19843/m.39704 type:complete len:207 (-) Transcript_19843:12-632(-)